MNPFRPLLVLLVTTAYLPLWAAPAPKLVVEAPPKLAAVANEVRALERDDFSEILLLTGTTGFLTPIHVILVPEDSPFAAEVPAWVSGFARNGEAVIVLFPGRVRSYPDRNLRTLVHHEVAHVQVAQAANGNPVPRWFNEGVATVAAREWGVEDRARFSLAVLGGKCRSTRDVDVAFGGSDSEVRRAYALSAAFVRFIRQEYGSLAPAAVLRGLASGLEFDAAFLQATGVHLGRAEKIFFRRNAFWNTWVPFLTSTGALWMAVTLLALLAIYRRRVRSRRMIEEWEAEETDGFRQVRSTDDDVIN